MTDRTRRAILTGGVGALGLAAGALGAHATESPPTEPDRLRSSDRAATGDSLPRGLPDRVPAFGSVLAFDLVDRARATAIDFLTHVTRLGDALAYGDPTSLDHRTTGAAALDQRPASLQITPGIGGTLLDALGFARPAALHDLPAFAGDALRPELSGGDLLVQVAAEDPLKLAGAVQAVSSYTNKVRVRWSRPGFRSTAAGAKDPATTGRNLMGHRDGTNNPKLGSPLWHTTVTAREPAWMLGGSYVVTRQILIDLDAWFTHDVRTRDRVIGRHTTTGAPLGEHHEHDQVDLDTRADGQHVIPDHAHIRLASSRNTGGARIYRRGWNFDDGYVDGARHAGLMFLAWQADPREGFIPIQQGLVDHDELNRFTTHIGSAVFAVPARGEDQYVGQRLLEGA